MKKLLLIALLLWSAGIASATAYTANTTGPWNVAATWSGAGVPGAGDTAKINNAVTVTCPVAVTCTVGLAAADNTTEALGCTDATATGTGKLIVNGTFIFSGVINQCNGTWTIGAGATVTHDSSAHPAQHYAWIIGLNNGTAAKLDASAGTSGSHITFNIAGGSGYAGGTHGTGCGVGCNDNGSFYCTYCDVSDWGGNSTSFKLAEFAANTSGGFGWDNSNCVRCGQVNAERVCATCDWYFTNGRYTAPNYVAGAFSFNTDPGGFISATKTGGTRSFANSLIVGGFFYFSSTLVRGSSIHFTASNTIFESTCGASDAAPLVGNRSYQFDTFTNVLIYNCTATTGNPSSTPGGTNLTRLLIMRTGNTANAHVMGDIVAATTIDGAVMQLEGDQGAGSSNADGFQTLTSPTAAYALILKHILFLPDAGGHGLGSVVNHSDGTACNDTTGFCPLVTAENNTWCGTDSGNLVIALGGENNTGHANIFTSGRNNLGCFGLTGTTFNAGIAWFSKWSSTSTPVANSYANMDYNGCINCTAGIANRYFRSVSDPTEYTITPGAHDVSVATNPFVDPTANFQKWCQTLDGAATTFALCIADINAGTITTTQVFATTTGAYDWIRARWAPKGAAGLSLKAAGYDGSDIGAVPWVAGSCGSGMALMGVGCN